MTVKELVVAMLQRQRAIARKLGSDFGRAPKDVRVLNICILVVMSVVIKTLLDNNVISGSDVMATLDGARDDDWEDQPLHRDEDES